MGSYFDKPKFSIKYTFSNRFQVGDRILTGSGQIARLFSLANDAQNRQKEKVWRIEPNSDFPVNRKRTDGSHCMARDEESFEFVD